MRLPIAAFAALGLLACPAAASAAPALYNAFQTICVKTGAEPAAARTAAGPGWTVMDQGALPPALTAGFTMAKNLKMYAHAGADGGPMGSMMFLADLPSGAGTIPLCMLVATTTEAESATAMKDWIGAAPPVRSDNGIDAYLMLAGAPAPVAMRIDDPRLQEGLANGRIALVMFGTRGTAQMMGYAPLGKPPS